MIKSTLASIPLGLATGFAFGTALEKSKVYLPDVIRGQMALENFTMMKIFLVACIIGTLSIALLESLGLGRRSPKKALSVGIDAFGSYGGNIVGGLLLGAGMAISGACPGTLLTQIGAGVQYSWYGLFGAMLGAISFGYLDTFLRRRSDFGRETDEITVDQYFHKSPVGTGLVMAILFAVALVSLEDYHRWTDDLKLALPYPNVKLEAALPHWHFRDVVWSPYESGILIGFLQIPSLIWMGTLLGASSAFCTIGGHIAKLFDSQLELNAPYLASYMRTVQDYWQVGLAAGIVIGSYISQQLSPIHPILTNTVGPIPTLLGAFIMMMGARIAGGCPTGHGMSGVAQQSIPSIVTLLSLFGGGMTTSYFLS